MILVVAITAAATVIAVINIDEVPGQVLVAIIGFIAGVIETGFLSGAKIEIL
jgi:hypothetical protein